MGEPFGDGGERRDAGLLKPRAIPAERALFGLFNAIGDGADTGVIDPYHRLYGHPGISVVDGAAVSANLGVNPSLTITAQAERAMSFWPNKGEADPRPAQGAAYARLAPVEPKSPAVPAHAFGALRLPFLGVPEVPRKK